MVWILGLVTACAEVSDDSGVDAAAVRWHQVDLPCDTATRDDVIGVDVADVDRVLVYQVRSLVNDTWSPAAVQSLYKGQIVTVCAAAPVRITWAEW